MYAQVAAKVRCPCFPVTGQAQIMTGAGQGKGRGRARAWQRVGAGQYASVPVT